MKEILILLVLLNARNTKVFSLPYQADSGGNCRNTSTEYQRDGTNLCCQKCPPGHRLKDKCTETTETVCEPCRQGQFLDSWNYSPNCFSCTRCKTIKGLQYAQNCTSTTRSKCSCKPGMYCIMGFDALQYCTECKAYKPCKAGYGVSVPGTANSDVKCEQCGNGMFSDIISHTDKCQPHTNCGGMAVLRKGDATSDNVCEPQSLTKQSGTQSVSTTASVTTSTVAATSDSTTSPGQESTTVNRLVPSQTTQSPTPGSDWTGLAVIIPVAFAIVLFIVLMCICKRICRSDNGQQKDSAQLPPKVDANGNCESADKVAQHYMEESQVTSFTATYPEQQRLLENGEAGGDHSQCSTSTETRTDGYSSHDSISPSQSTLALNYPHSTLSEPMPLISSTEPISPQPSNLARSLSQPSSAHVISPVTTSPHVNVNITLHIGNGSCGTPSFMPADLMQGDCKLPFGAEEESFSIPQQEAGKPSLMSVQESGSYST